MPERAHLAASLAIAFSLALFFGAAPLEAAKLEVIDLAWGYDPEDNLLGAPVFEGASAPPLRFEAIRVVRDPQAEFIRRIPGGFVRPLRYELAPGLDLGALLAASLRSEAGTLGLRSSPENEAVVVRGQLLDPFVENRGVFGGAILFYSYFAVELELAWPDGRTQRLAGSFHDMAVRVNGGFGAKDEAGEATARLLVNAAQEIVARIARDHLKAPVLPAVKDLIPTLAASGADDRYPSLRRLGLSGLPEAAPLLLELMARQKEEDDRAQVIGALASLRDPAAVDKLAAAYRQDGAEDCRFAMLKAFAYLGGDQAAGYIRELGLADKDSANSRLARYLAGRKGADR
jgi:hypothetical protein